MKRYVEKEKEETTNELTNWIGVVLTDEEKGAILYVGDTYHIICSNVRGIRNDVCGGKECDGSSVEDTLNQWKNDTRATPIKYIYCFDSFRELMQWFTDSITE